MVKNVDILFNLLTPLETRLIIFFQFFFSANHHAKTDSAPKFIATSFVGLHNTRHDHSEIIAK